MRQKHPVYAATITKHPHDDALSNTDTMIHYISSSTLKNKSTSTTIICIIF